MLNKIIAALIITVVSSAANALPNKEYKLKGTPELGSKLPRIEATSPIPFNKSYQQLTPQQQQIFRDNYEQLGENETPPFPKSGLQSIYKPIIKGHKRIGRAGKLFLVAMVDASGKVLKVAVYDSPATAMTNYASAVLLKTKFDPAICNDKPCAMEFPFEFDLLPVKRSNHHLGLILGHSRGNAQQH